MRTLLGKIFPTIVVSAGLLLGLPKSAATQGWPDIFDPGQILTLNLVTAPADWSTIQGDTSFSIKVPAQFWLDGEAPIVISVRRKSG